MRDRTPRRLLILGSREQRAKAGLPMRGVRRVHSVVRPDAAVLIVRARARVEPEVLLARRLGEAHAARAVRRA